MKIWKRKELNKKRDWILLLAVIVCLLFSLGMVVWLLSRDARLEVTDKLYQYYFGIRYEYEEVTLFTDENGKRKLINESTDVLLDSVPLYYCDKNTLITTTDMVLVCPNSTNTYMQTPVFTEFTSEELSLRCNDRTSEAELGGGFLFDGKNMYVFLEPMTITIDNESITVEPLSWAEVIYNKTVRIYSKKDDGFIMRDIKKEEIKAICSHGYEVILSSDKLVYADGRESLLFTEPTLLKSILPSGQ